MVPVQIITQLLQLSNSFRSTVSFFLHLVEKQLSRWRCCYCKLLIQLGHRNGMGCELHIQSYMHINKMCGVCENGTSMHWQFFTSALCCLSNSSERTVISRSAFSSSCLLWADLSHSPCVEKKVHSINPNHHHKIL